MPELGTAAFLRGSPRTAALAATVDNGPGDLGYVHLVTAAIGREPAPSGVRLLANGRGAMAASLEAAYLWVRLNLDRVRRHLLRPGPSLPYTGQGPFPSLDVVVTPLYEKDQGSMGAAFALAMLAFLLDRGLRRDVAVCAEVDVRGRLWPVGGVAAKAKAFAKVGVTTVIVGRRSTCLDLRRVGVQLVVCDTVWDLLNRCFLPEPHRCHRLEATGQQSALRSGACHLAWPALTALSACLMPTLQWMMGREETMRGRRHSTWAGR